MGDIGLGALADRPPYAGQRRDIQALPVLNGDYGRAFARIDAFGVRVLPLGAGSVEILGQYRDDAFTPPGGRQRDRSLPVGVGTLQITDVGGFEFRALHDFGPSRGNLIQARYLAEIGLGSLTIYPEFGFEFQSRNYVRYYASASDAGQAGHWQPSASVSPSLGAFVEAKLSEQWALDIYVKRTFLGSVLADSPIATRRTADSTLIALVRHFK